MDGTMQNRSTLSISLDNVRVTLASVWLIGTGMIVLIVVVQSLLGHFGDKVQEAWGWLLPTIIPSLGMILTVLGYTALDPDMSTNVVRVSFYRIALGLSIAYLFLISLTILIEPFTSRRPTELMSLSNLWLGPFQGLVASALGVLFVSKRKQTVDGNISNQD
jgi:MFS family permease